MENILITGGNGKTGRRIFERLHNLGANVVAASRQSTVPFDWYREETWGNALHGITSVYIAFQPDLAMPGALDVMTRFTAAAVKANVRKLVLLSGRGEKEAQACEEVVKTSGLHWTILRSSFFMQNFTEGSWSDGIISRDFVIPQIAIKEPFVDADDIADMAVEVLLHDYHGSVFELTGPDLLSFSDAVSKIADALDAPIRFTEIALTDYNKILSEAGLPQDMLWLITYLFTEVLDGRNESVQHDIPKVLKRAPGTFDEFVQKSIMDGHWHKADIR